MPVTEIVAVDLRIVPIVDEAERLESIALANDLRSKLSTHLAAQEGLTITNLPTIARSSDVIEIARTVIQSAYDHRTELTTLIGTALTAITALGIQRRVAEIEIAIGDRKLSLKGIDIDSAEQLIREFLPAQIEKPSPEKPRVTVRTRKRRDK